MNAKLFFSESKLIFNNEPSFLSKIHIHLNSTLKDFISVSESQCISYNNVKYKLFQTWLCLTLKGAMSYFFLAFLQTSYGFNLIKTFKLQYFYLPLYSEITDRGKITVATFISGLDLSIFPCFKYTVYQICYFALIAK